MALTPARLRAPTANGFQKNLVIDGLSLQIKDALSKISINTSSEYLKPLQLLIYFILNIYGRAAAGSSPPSPLFVQS